MSVAGTEATREILEMISRSRADAQPVYDAILSQAAVLCDTPMARLHLVDDDHARFRVAAFWGDAPRRMLAGESWPLDPSFTLSRTLVLARRFTSKITPRPKTTACAIRLP